MRRRLARILYLVALIAVVVGMDVLFFRGHVWERLSANVAVVVAFAAFYFRFLRQA